MKNRRQGWGYTIDYKKEIALDEATVRWYSSDACVKVAAACDELSVKHGHASTIEFWDVFDVCLERPELREVLGLSKADLVGLTLTFLDIAPTIWEKAEALWGPLPEFKVGPQGEAARELLRAGEAMWKRLSIDGVSKWQDWHPVGEQRRKEFLKKAKTTLARHKRNASKWGK